jgi:hypothetical protein
MINRDIENLASYQPIIKSTEFISNDQSVDENADINEFPLAFLSGEIEVLNIIMNSHFGDEMSLRLTNHNGLFQLIICSEYTRTYFNFINTYDHIPTQKEIVSAILEMEIVPGTKYIDAIIEQSEFSTINQFIDFFHFYSTYYPNVKVLLEYYLHDKRYF